MPENNGNTIIPKSEQGNIWELMRDQPETNVFRMNPEEEKYRQSVHALQNRRIYPFL